MRGKIEVNNQKVEHKDKEMEMGGEENLRVNLRSRI